MDIEYLKRFLVVGQELNFRKASELLFISQPALTHSINTLEKELNVTLLERNTKNVKLTEAGKIFLESCTNLLTIYDNAIASITYEASKTSNVLNIGYVGPALGKNFSPWIMKFRELYPDINIQIIRYRSTEVAEALENRSIQLAFVYEGNITNNAVDYTVVSTEKFKLMVNKQSPLAIHDSLPLSRIKDEYFLICNKESSPNYYATVMSYFEEAGISPKFSYGVKDISEIYRLIDMNMGVAIMSVADTSYYENYDLKFIDIEGIDEEKLSHRKVLAWLGDLTPAAKKFLKVADSMPLK